MAKKRSRRMQPVQDVATAEEQNLARELADAERTLESQLGRLEELKRHRQDYTARSREAGSLGSTQWRDYRLFLDRLNHAIVAQERIVTGWRTRCDGVRRQWQQKRRRVESLDRIVERYRRSERLEDERREQRRLDAEPPPRQAFGED